MALKNKRKVKVKPNVKLTRKQLRKEKRKEKKLKRNDYYTNRGKNKLIDSNTEQHTIKETKKKENINSEIKAKPLTKVSANNKVLSTEEQNRKEKKEQKKLQKDMSKQRKQQLLKENMKEDQTIRKLEKQLKLHKRKSKSIPKSFAEDGLDYLLEVCDPEYLKTAASAEKDLFEANDEFEEDFALMTGKKIKSNKSKKDKHQAVSEESDNEDFEDNSDTEKYSDVDLIDEEDEEMSGNEDDISDEYSDENSESEDEPEIKSSKKRNKKDEKITADKTYSDSDDFDSDDISQNENIMKSKKRKLNQGNEENIKKKKQKLNEGKINPQTNEDEDDSDFLNEDDDSDFLNEDEESGVDSDGIESQTEKQERNEVWEDIYGRLRTKDGAVVNNSEGKYIPPAIRAKMEGSGSEDKKRKEKLDRLRKQLKGLLNRLAESNMHNIAGQIETLYMNNSRNDMNETLNALIMESLVSPVLAPERLLMEHVLLMSVLHANVGTEIGAHFLQTTIKKFDSLFSSPQNVEDKTLDNIVNILAQLYNFKVFDARLLYEILHKLATQFEEKNVECILHILRSVGFGLRKDDPIALKNLILELQKQAASASEGKISNSRVKFLLDILLAIKNNNVTKIPNYDTTYSEHLKKLMKGFIRKGNYVTPLNISLEDLLKADERGKWWVVGSAWSGNLDNTDKKEKAEKTDNFSQQLLDLARKQRMNTDTRRDIFCIIMSAEDYLDAFEKLLKLSLKNQQEREIIHVILHCCLQEKVYNPYYAVLAQKFCDYDRKFQMTIKYSVWDKLKVLNNHSGGQLSNLAKLLTHLFIEKGLSISTLKIVEFSELDKVSLRFMRQILLGILLHNDLEALLGVFEKVAQSDKLKMFRESLRLFIHHFLLRNLKSESLPEDQKKHLEDRAKIVEKILTAKDSRLKL